MKRTLAVSLFCSYVIVAAAPLSAQTAIRDFTVPPGLLSDALTTFTRQSGLQLVYRSEQVASKRTQGVSGRLPPREALSRLIRGTGLRIVEDASGAIALTRDEPRSENSSPARRAGPVADVTPIEPGEIIVTARKRQETLLKVPAIENVVTKEVIERQSITDLVSLSSKVPGLFMGTGAVSVGPQISIRGVGTSTSDAGVDQSALFNIDGLSLSQGLAYASGLFDLAQVEVMKGPQALFFGKNSPAGVIALRTADPTPDLAVIGRAIYEVESRERRGELIVSTPLTNTLGIRLAGMAAHSDGYFRNKATALPGTGALDPKDKRYPNARNYIVRGTLVWRPSDEFNIRTKANWTKDNIHSQASRLTLTSCPEGLGAPAGIAFLNPNDDCKLNRTSYSVDLDPAAFPGIMNNGRPFFYMVQKFGTVEANYRPSRQLTLTSLTGFYRNDLTTMINGTDSGYAGPLINAENTFYREDFTQEFRINSDFSGPVNITAGSFYQRGTVYNQITLLGNQAYNLEFLPPDLSRSSNKVSIDSISAFGQLRWRPATEIELSGGARWTRETRKDRVLDLISGSPVLIPIDRPRISSDKISPELTVSYTPNDNLNLFASVKRGYKSGSYSFSPGVFAGMKNDFGDEEVTGAEIGLKSRLLDRALSFNVAGYYYDYKGLQVGVTVPDVVTGFPLTRTLNAGAARIYGVDFEANYRLTSAPGVTLHAIGNWNHARFTNLQNVPCSGGQTIAQGCNQVLDPSTGNFVGQNLTGMPLVRAPEWQLSAGALYERKIGHNKLTFGVDGQYTSRYLAGLGGRADLFQPGYFLINANASIARADDRWQLALIANNIADKVTTGSCGPSNLANGFLLGGQVTGGTGVGPAGLDEIACSPRAGRQLILRLTLKTGNSH